MTDNFEVQVRIFNKTTGRLAAMEKEDVGAVDEVDFQRIKENLAGGLERMIDGLWDDYA